MARPIKLDFTFNSEINLRPIINRAIDGHKESVQSLVRDYMDYQEQRLRLMAQMVKDKEFDRESPVRSVAFEFFQWAEEVIKKGLEEVTEKDPIGKWCKSHLGVGPVISSGFLSYIDIEKAPTAGHIYSYAGLTGVKWEKGQKRPWNPDLKKICFYLGESFIKVSGNPDAFYGKLYRIRREIEVEMNERGDHKELAAYYLKNMNYRDDTSITKIAHMQGKLVDGHLTRRAARWAVKMFISHLHKVWFEKHYGRPAPLPYAIAHLNHAHMLEPELKSVVEASMLSRKAKYRGKLDMEDIRCELGFE